MPQDEPITDKSPRCQGTITKPDGGTLPCPRTLGEEITRPWRIVCRLCKTVNVSPPSGSAPAPTSG